MSRRARLWLALGSLAGLGALLAWAVLGLSLAVLFLAFGAPDVALSQIVVAGVAVPVMVLLALAKIRTDERREKE